MKTLLLLALLTFGCYADAPAGPKLYKLIDQWGTELRLKNLSVSSCDCTNILCYCNAAHDGNTGRQIVRVVCDSKQCWLRQ